MNATLPPKKASSPTRTERKWTSGTGTGAVEAATAPESFALSCCATAHSTRRSSSAASLHSVSASSTLRWLRSRRWRRRTIAACAADFRRRACSRRASMEREAELKGGGVPVPGLPSRRGRSWWCDEGIADRRCPRAPESEGASSTLSVRCVGSSAAVGALCPRCLLYTSPSPRDS